MPFRSVRERATRVLWALCIALLCHQAASLPAARPDRPQAPGDYASFEQMEAYLKKLSEVNPAVELSQIGKSHENRTIWLVKIQPSRVNCRHGGEADPHRDAVWIEGGLHAREWISPATSLQLIDKLSGECEQHCDKVFYIAPMSNPDGYEYSRSAPARRLWRKNRATNPGSECRGVDLNRNWDVYFGVGASSDPCSDTYKGSEPFSEPETKALSEAMKRVPRLKLVLSLHSYGQKVLYPWGYTATPPANKDRLVAVGAAFREAAQAHHGASYDVINSGGDFYYASGATDDWALTAFSAAYVYTLELRDTGLRAFELPAAEIAAVGKEVFVGLHAMLDEINSIDSRNAA